MSITLELRISGTFSLKVMPSTVTAALVTLRRVRPRTHLVRDPLAHAVVDAAAGKDDLRVIAGFLGAVGQIIRVDADAVTADETRLVIAGNSIGRRGGEHVAGVDAELMKDRRQFVHERDVEIALGVLDHLGGFRDLDRRRAMNAGGDNRTVDVGDDVERPRVLGRQRPS